MTLAIQRGDENVSSLIAPIWELMVSSQLDAHPAQQLLVLGHRLQLLSQRQTPNSLTG